jgi:hypothetical protein
MSYTFREIKQCRICSSHEFEVVLNLDDQYIASAFVGEAVSADLSNKYPLELVRCSSNKGCGLVQLKHSVNPDLMYADGYGYRSEINESMRDNLKSIVNQTVSIVELQDGDTVIDIGCNDGTLLNFYQDKNIDKVGFDLVLKIIESAREKGIDGINEPFSAESFLRNRPGIKAKIITSIAMFYDLEDPSKFVQDVSSVLHDEGVWVIELSYLPTMLDMNSFDTICHEHLEYYSLRQIEWMASRNGLQVTNVEFNDINGGSFRVFLQKEFIKVSSSAIEKIEAIREREQDLCLNTDKPYNKFRKEIEKFKESVTSLLFKLKSEGKMVYAYGASTKGNVLLQYAGITPELVQKAAERNQEKWGLYTLGTNIPIISEAEARRDMPDYFFVLPWHFFSGFVKREREFLERGGKFILPLPEVKIVGKDDFMNG